MIIDIISKFNDKGVRKATKSFAAFAKGTIGVQLSIAGVGYAMTKMVKAAAEDERAVAALSRTLANAGWAKSTAEVNDFIDATQRATGVADDELRPAFTSLFNALGNADAAMGAVTMAMDIANGTGKSLTQVTDAMAKAAAGNRKSLLSLGTGIDKVTLQTADLNTVFSLMGSKFAGQAATAAETTAGKFDRLKIAGAEAGETIGSSLTNAFVTLVGGGSVDNATKNIDQFATSLGWAIEKAGTLASKVATLIGALFNLPKIINEKLYGPLDERGGFTFDKIDTSVISSTLAKVKNAAALQKVIADLEKKQAAAAKTAAKAETVRAAAAAKTLKVKQLAYKFDTQAANIAAAQKRAQTGAIANRLDLLSLLNQESAGLPVSDTALAKAQQQVVNITINNAGSVVTEAELTASISAQLMAQRIRSGTVLGSPAEFRFFEQSTR